MMYDILYRHGDKTGVTPASNLQPLAAEELDQEVSVDYIAMSFSMHHCSHACVACNSRLIATCYRMWLLLSLFVS